MEQTVESLETLSALTTLLVSMYELILFDLLPMYTHAVQCDEPHSPESGVIVAVSGRGEGDTLTFQCNSGFTPAGAMASVCTSSGDWQPDPSTFQCSRGN